MSKYGQLIDAARKTDSKKARKTETEIDSEPGVNLSIKVPKSRRQHWAAEAKRQGITLTAAITEALRDRFGEPE
jgi:LDH2 family malate/lactate/ureidoglycolate dehydrogenase